MPAPLIGLAAKEALKKAGSFVAKRDPVVLGAAAVSPFIASLGYEEGERKIKERDKQKKLQKQYEEQDKQEGREMKKGNSGGADSDGMKKGGSVSSASKRADGCAMRGKTKGRMV
jgi:hypothetical protein